MTTYLSLTNDLLQRLGEVVMDSTEFATARNVQSLAKAAINSSVRELLHETQEWPFTLTTYTQTLSSGTNTYSLPADASSVDWESFYLKKFNDYVSAKPLRVIDYPEYLAHYRATDDNNGSDGYAPPDLIFQTQDLYFGVTPIPDDAYEIEYKYWAVPSDLDAHDDVCIVPDRFKNVVLDGAMVYMMLYRSNEQSASMHETKFKDGIKSMRRVLLDEPLEVKSTAVQQIVRNLRVR